LKRFGCLNEDNVVLLKRFGCLNEDNVVLLKRFGCLNEDGVVLLQRLGCLNEDNAVLLNRFGCVNKSVKQIRVRNIIKLITIQRGMYIGVSSGKSSSETCIFVKCDNGKLTALSYTYINMNIVNAKRVTLFNSLFHLYLDKHARNNTSNINVSNLK